MKKFNVTGLCVPNMHYMVDISAKLTKIKEMIDEGLYFAINRRRQYGKTTTMNLISSALNKDEYLVLNLSFESIDSDAFESRDEFLKTL